MITRRKILLGAVGLAGAAVAYRLVMGSGPVAAAEVFKVTHTDEEWQKLLTPQQYAVLRQQGTERPSSSPLLEEHRAGMFACAGCDLALFSSTTKFDSGTGWPSFWAPLQERRRHTADTSFGMERTAVHCAPLRRPSRPCLRRRAAADRPALLHERRGPGLPPRRGLTGKA